MPKRSFFVLTPGSFQSRVCNEELAYARELGKRVIPLVRQTIDDATVSAIEERSWGEQACGNWTSISRINWLFCRRTRDCACEYDSAEPFDPARDSPECD